MRGEKFSIGLMASLAIFAVIMFVTSTWAATQEKVLYSFCSQTNCTDGNGPSGGLISDAAGDLYGTTSSGGSYNYGTVFELTPAGGGGWTEKVLYSFNNRDGGGYPAAGLIFDAAGNLYGTTAGGGTYGYGTVFEFTRSLNAVGGGWTEKVLYSFNNNGTDASNPDTSLIIDAAGNLYGTTYFGGTYDQGTVFELTPIAGGRWTEKVLHSFNDNGTDGYEPQAGLILDAAGNLYGTTTVGGPYGGGTVFELTRSINAVGGGWTEKVLHSFNPYSGTDGSYPLALIFDAAGDLYGTTYNGGTYNVGNVFELTSTEGGWTEQVLFSFDFGDGGAPEAGLIFDTAGNLYGTTAVGGDIGGCSLLGCGTAFELTPEAGGGWTEQVLHSFDNNGTDGYVPKPGLTLDAAGNLYGTTAYGGTYDAGTVFEITR